MQFCQKFRELVRNFRGSVGKVYITLHTRSERVIPPYLLSMRWLGHDEEDEDEEDEGWQAVQAAHSWLLHPYSLSPLPPPSPSRPLSSPPSRIARREDITLETWLFSVDEFVSVFCQSSFLMNFQPYTILKYSNLFFLFYNGDSLTTRCPVIPKDLPYLFARNRPFWSYVFLRS